MQQLIPHVSPLPWHTDGDCSGWVHILDREEKVTTQVTTHFRCSCENLRTLDHPVHFSYVLTTWMPDTDLMVITKVVGSHLLISLCGPAVTFDH